MNGRLRVLHVEDNELDAALVERELGPDAEVVRVDDAKSLHDALDGREGWDVVLTDHTLPSLDSIGVIRIVRAAPVPPPVVVVSGQIGEQNLARAMVEGAADYVAKDRLALLRPAVERVVRAERDAHERARLEREIRLFFDLSVDLFAVTELDGRFRRMNSAWQATLGRTEDDLRARGLRGLVHPDDRAALRAAMERLAAGEHVKGAETRVRAGDGSTVTLLWNAIPVIEDGALHVSARDVTAQKHAEEAAARRERLASLGTLVAGVAHEINNPLMYVRGSVEIIEATTRRLERELPSHASVLQGIAGDAATALRGLERIALITNGLRRVARPGGQARSLESVPDLVRDVLPVAAPRVGRDVEVVTDFRSSARVLCDPGELSQVILNLVINAGDAMSDGRGRLSVTCRDEDAHVLLEVADTGAGIPPERHAQVFTPFFTTKAQGTGLGLSISRSIVAEHGGDITFESAPGAGTTFRIRLPAARAGGEAA